MRFAPLRGRGRPGPDAPSGTPYAGGTAPTGRLLAGTGLLLVLGGTVGAGTVLLAAGVALQVLFLAFLVRHLAFAASARAVPADLALPAPGTPPGAMLPTVAVLVACHEEAAVVDRLCSALLALDYPTDRLEVHLVDDGSADGTAAALAAATADAPHVRIHRRPPGAGGGKSGALNAVLPYVTSSVVVVYDADHRPHPDSLRRLVRHFADPAVAAVQGRCVIRGAATAVARAVEVDYLAGYLVNEYGRQALAGMPAYGGANCAVRTRLLRDLGGWNPLSVTEDTDLTLRLVLGGHRVRYDVTAVDEEEAATTLRRYWRQRYRWARGHQQACRDYLRPVWSAGHLGLGQKVETSMFLLAFHLPALSLAGLLLVPLAAAGVLRQPAVPLWVLATVLLLGPLVELGTGLLLARAPARYIARLLWFPVLFLVGAALCARAWIDGARGQAYAWVKTPRADDLAAAAGSDLVRR